jgi:membrane associated rhomboid family serine protease
VAASRSPSAPAGKERTRGLQLLAALIALMWLVEAVDLVAGDLDAHGIRPRDEEGLPGILFAPFLHGSFAHLLGNTVALVVLGAVVALGGLRVIALVTLIIALVAGVGTWAVAPPGTLHIGASGISFGYISYLVVRGLYSGSALHLAAGVIVLALWGGTLMTGLIPSQGISWQGHLFGALGGILAARLLHVAARSRMPVARGF